MRRSKNLKVIASKEVFTGIRSPDRMLIEFAVVKKNVVGALAKISTAIANLGINILSGFVTAYPNEPKAIFSFVADLTNLNLSVEKVVEKLQAIDVVLSVWYQKPQVNGFMVDDMHFPLLAIGERSILFRVDTIKDMFDRLYEKFGSGAAVIFHEMGIAAGERRADSLSSKYNLKGKELLKVIFAERVSKGWGIPKLIGFYTKKEEAVVRVNDLFECYPFKEKLKGSRSQYFRGYLRGVFRFIFGKDVDVVEKYCIAKGDKYCEFHISKREG